MTTSLAAARTALFDALSTVDGVQVYRHRVQNFQYPAMVVGWPTSLDVRADMGFARDFVIDVDVAVEVIDPESSDELLSDLLEQAVEALQGDSAWDVRPVTNFGEQLLADDRTIVWCRLPVAMFE